MLREKNNSLLVDDARMAQGWIVEGGDDDENESTTSTCTDEIIRELDEDNFQSEDEPENNDFMFDVSDREGY